MADRPHVRIIPFPRAPEPHVATPITIRDLRLAVDGRPLLDGVSMDLSPDGITALIGPNGAGKSLLMRVIAELVRADAGSIRLPDPMYGRIAHVAQKPVLLRRSVRANLGHALRLTRLPRRTQRARLDELLELGRLTDLTRSPARRLSGGETQRLAIVRALARDPALLLLDEPGAGLDPHSMHALETLMGEIAASGTKIVLVTHDLGQLARVAGEIAFLHAGRCHEVALAAAFLERPGSAAGRAYLDGRLLL